MDYSKYTDSKGHFIIDGMDIDPAPYPQKKDSKGVTPVGPLYWEGSEFQSQMSKEEAIALILRLAKAFDVQRSDLISVHTPPDKDS